MTQLPDYARALELALRSVQPLNRSEPVELGQAGRRILATPAVADRDLPPFDRAQMDGYAIRSSDFVPGRAWEVMASIPAGHPADVRVPPGACVAIATGAPLPSGLDTVIPHEWSDRGEKTVRFTAQSIERGHAVHPRGADAKKGQEVISKGTIVAAHHMGIAASVGAAQTRVAARPRAIVLSSGDEIVPVSSAVLAQQIRNSNAPMARELLERFGAEVIRTAHLPDERGATVDAVGDAVEESDLLVTIGGISAGERDHFPAAFEAAGVELTLRGASIQPGRPVMVGRAVQGTAVIGLPGNPVSVLACSCLFAWPMVRVLLGLDGHLPWMTARLGEAVKPNSSRRAFRPAVLRDDGCVIVPTWAGSGDLAHTAPTHGLVELPVQREPVPADTPLRFLPWP